MIMTNANKIYDGNVNEKFQGKKVPKEKSSLNCFSLIMPDSVVKAKKKYYPKRFWKNVNMK